MKQETQQFHDKIKANKNIWHTQHSSEVISDSGKSVSFLIILIFTFVMSYIIFSNSIF